MHTIGSTETHYLILNEDYKIDIRENRKGNQEMITHRHGQYWAQGTEQTQTKQTKYSTES